jgi:hypothetical protein
VRRPRSFKDCRATKKRWAEHVARMRETNFGLENLQEAVTWKAEKEMAIILA